MHACDRIQAMIKKAGHNCIRHNSLDHDFLGLVCTCDQEAGHNLVGHTYVGHNFVGHEYAGHDYMGLVHRV